MGRAVSHYAVFLVLAMLALGTFFVPVNTWAKPLPGQEGLPPELVISAVPPLDDQIDALEDLADYAEENAPETGFVASLKQMFSGQRGPQLINISDLAAHVEDLKGEIVAVEGVYEKQGESQGLLRSIGATCHLAWAGGAQPQGFPKTGPEGLPVRAEGMVEVNEQGEPVLRVQKLTPALVLTFIRLARAYELDEEYEDAVEAYQAAAQASGTSGYLYGAFAQVHGAEVALSQLQDKHKARQMYDRAWTAYAAGRDGDVYTWTRPSEGDKWQRQPVRETIAEPLDSLKRGGFWYGLVDAFVTVAGGHKALGIILLAIVTRLMIYPLTKKQLSSMQAMQRIQPQIKQLQKKYKDDKQKFQEEFWNLCKEHNVNPLGGCLPLIVQMPILIMIYRGIRDYVVQFDGASFLWVHNLSQPDMPLLVAYAISMFLFQKMTEKMNPAASADPQQAQQQKMMAYLMPAMFFFLFRGLSAAFILYWVRANLVYFCEHLWYRRTHAVAEEPEKGSKGAGGFAAAMAKVVSGAVGKAGEKDKDKTAPLPSYEKARAASEGRKIGKEKDKKKK